MKNIVELVKSPWTSDWHQQAEKIFSNFLQEGERYLKKARNVTSIRSPKITLEENGGVPYFALIHPSNAPSGPYGGMSFVLFPSQEKASLISLGIGTQGLAPDENVLGRPGHARKLSAICKLLNQKYGNQHRVAWAKKDPCRTDLPMPQDVRTDFNDEHYQRTFDRYGNVLYAIVDVSSFNDDAIAEVLKLFLDLMFEERGVPIKASCVKDAEKAKQEYLSCLLPDVSKDDVVALLKQRRYVIIEGPPGTGKTRLAQEISNDSEKYAASKCVQFHPNMTYEQFIGGLFPESVAGSELGFAFRPHMGILMESVKECSKLKAQQNFLLHIDEINRADLAKVLGESIILLEPNSEYRREIGLNFNFGEPINDKLSVPDNLHILGTMNSADRSIAILDIAIRRRFAFVQLYPQMNVVNKLGCEITKNAFTKLLTIFIEHAFDDSFKLMPGHSYFITPDGIDGKTKLMTELKPLLEEYLEQGYVAGFDDELRSYIQWLEVICE